jgi:hypothetical protein
MKYKYKHELGVLGNFKRLKYKLGDIYQNLESLKLIQVRKEFSIFWPNSAGSTSQQKAIAMQTMQDVFKNLRMFSQHNIIGVEDFRKLNGVSESDHLLGNILKKYGSDKSISHNYDQIYEVLFRDPKQVSKVFEIGIGSINSKIVSNMGPAGHPGSSLRAFRDYFANAEIVGVDIDKDILFKEERINTYHLDQLDLSSFDTLSPIIGDQFDLMIDDGLHTIDANLNSLHFFISRISKGGYAIIEDIPSAASPVWLMMCKLLNEEGAASLVDTKDGLLFVFKKN